MKEEEEEFSNEYKSDPISFVDSRFFFPNIDINYSSHERYICMKNKKLCSQFSTDQSIRIIFIFSLIMC